MSTWSSGACAPALVALVVVAWNEALVAPEQVNLGQSTPSLFSAIRVEVQFRCPTGQHDQGPVSGAIASRMASYERSPAAITRAVASA